MRDIPCRSHPLSAERHNLRFFADIKYNIHTALPQRFTLSIACGLRSRNMAHGKKYKVKVRVKVRHRIVRHAGLALAVCAAAVVLGCSGLWAARALSTLSPGRFFAFKARSLSVTSPSEEISAEISRRMSGKMGGSFLRADAAALAAGLKTTYPSLSRVEVRRNFLGGRVSVDAVPENIVAKVRLTSGGRAKSPGGGENFYLADNGRLLEAYYGRGPDTLFETEVNGGRGAGLAPLAAFLRELNAMASGFSSRPVRLEYPAPEDVAAAGAQPGREQSCRLTLADGASVLWGDFEFTKAKISRLNEVLPAAARRLGGPLRVDMRYFRDGKVFVSKAGDI